MIQNKIVIAINLEPAELSTLGQLRTHSFPPESEIHLVHVFEMHYLNFDFVPTLQPKKEDLLAIQKWGEEKLTNYKEELGLDLHANCQVKCLISSNPKQEFLAYCDKLGADLIIAGTKERSGIKGVLDSSFTNFLHKFSSAHLLLLRPRL